MKYMGGKDRGMWKEVRWRRNFAQALENFGREEALENFGSENFGREIVLDKTCGKHRKALDKTCEKYRELKEVHEGKGNTGMWSEAQ